MHNYLSTKLKTIRNAFIGVQASLIFFTGLEIIKTPNTGTVATTVTDNSQYDGK